MKYSKYRLADFFYLYSAIPAPYDCPSKHEFCSSASFFNDVWSFRALFRCSDAERFAALIRRRSTSMENCIILNWSSVEVCSWHLTVFKSRHCINHAFTAEYRFWRNRPNDGIWTFDGVLSKSTEATGERYWWSPRGIICKMKVNNRADNLVYN